MLNPTPQELLTDHDGRPYFLWDCDLTLDDFRSRLTDPDPSVRAYFIGKLMRQAKPDDVFQFVSRDDIRHLWQEIRPCLGKSREFWTWLLESWEAPRDATG